MIEESFTTDKERLAFYRREWVTTKKILQETDSTDETYITMMASRLTFIQACIEFYKQQISKETI